MNTLIAVILVLVVIAIFVIAIYNKLIKMRNHADEAWSDIDVQLKRRYNLIPNIIETVKGYATHEESVFVKVTEARSNAINAGTLKEQAQAENMLTGALKSLFAVAENYPNLRANENFMQLQNELVDTEDKIQAARRFYNGNVRDYNTALQQFPNNMIAGMFKFTEKEFFEIEDEEQKEVVKVSFDKKDDGEPKADATPAATPEAEEKPEPPADVKVEETPAVTEETKTEEPKAPTEQSATPETETAEPTEEKKDEEKPTE